MVAAKQPCAKSPGRQPPVEDASQPKPAAPAALAANTAVAKPFFRIRIYLYCLAPKIAVPTRTRFAPSSTAI